MADVPYWFERTDWQVLTDAVGEPVLRPDGTVVTVRESTGQISDTATLTFEFLGFLPVARFKTIQLSGSFTSETISEPHSFDWTVGMQTLTRLRQPSGNPYSGERVSEQLDALPWADDGQFSWSGSEAINQGQLNWEDGVSGAPYHTYDNVHEFYFSAEIADAYQPTVSFEPIRGRWNSVATDGLSGSLIEMYIFGFERPLYRPLLGDLTGNGELDGRDESIGLDVQSDTLLTLDDVLFPVNEYYSATGQPPASDFRRFAVIPEPSTGVLGVAAMLPAVRRVRRIS